MLKTRFSLLFLYEMCRVIDENIHNDVNFQKESDENQAVNQEHTTPYLTQNMDLPSTLSCRYPAEEGAGAAGTAGKERTSWK